MRSAKHKRVKRKWKDSKIEWCGHTFNPLDRLPKGVTGLRSLLRRSAKCVSQVEWRYVGSARAAEADLSEYWKQPLKWNREAGDLNTSTAIDRGCFVHRLPTCLIIRFHRRGAKTCLN